MADFESELLNILNRLVGAQTQCADALGSIARSHESIVQTQQTCADNLGKIAASHDNLAQSQQMIALAMENLTRDGGLKSIGVALHDIATPFNTGDFMDVNHDFKQALNGANAASVFNRIATALEKKAAP